MSHYKTRKTHLTEVNLYMSYIQKPRQVRKMKKCMCMYEMSGLQSDTDRGEPQGSVLRCELTSLFDIISCKQRGKKWCLLLSQEGKSSSSIAHSLFITLIYFPFFTVSSISLTKSLTSSFFFPPSSIFTSFSHGRRSYSVMRALHADSHNSTSPFWWVILESCWALLMDYLPSACK